MNDNSKAIIELLNGDALKNYSTSSEDLVAVDKNLLLRLVDNLSSVDFYTVKSKLKSAISSTGNIANLVSLLKDEVIFYETIDAIHADTAPVISATQEA